MSLSNLLIHMSTDFNNDDSFVAWMRDLVRDYGTDHICLSVILKIHMYQFELFGFRGVSKDLFTTNLIEELN